jgi:signal transduction histidine kinase
MLAVADTPRCMRSRSWIEVRAPSIATILAGQSVAGLVFFFTFHNSALRPIWLPQFYVLLLLATVLLLLALRCRTNVHRIVALLCAMIVEVVIVIPEGPELETAAVLGTVFIWLTMTEVLGVISVVISLGCSIVFASLHWPLVAWGERIEGAPPAQAVLLGLYLVFLTWLAGLVGSRGHTIRTQQEEILRIDRTVEALSEANLDFQELATRVQRETEDQERKRIAREVHDIVGYTLTNIQMMMEAATDLVKGRKEGLEDLLVKSRNQAQRGLLETRRAMRNLRQSPVVQSNGMQRVAEVARIFQRATKVSVRVRFGNTPASFGSAIDEVIYRMVQESLTNALRHGNATEISVHFWVMERSVRISISDNGMGSKEIVPGVGLAGMTERIAQIGGSMKAETTTFGFHVVAEIPL